MKRNVFVLLCVLFSLTAFAVTPVVNPPAKGGATIKGIVVDDLKEGLIGASVQVEGTTVGVVTNQSGEFVLSNLNQGKHSLKVSYVGYQPQTFTLAVAAGDVLKTDTIKLVATQNNLTDVVVYGSLVRGELKALNMKKSALKIVDVIAADGIGKFPDRNAGEAVQRIPGVAIERDQGEGRFVAIRGLPAQWSASTLNGDRIPTAEEETTSRATAFDFFPSELIDMVEVSKAITPDMEGDAMGGSVNFITKTSPEKRLLNITMGSGYNAKSEKGMLNGNLVFGDRSKDGKFGFILNASYWNRNWATDNFETRGNGIDISRLELRDYEGTRTTTGFNFATDYRPNKNVKLYLKMMQGGLVDNELHYKMRYRFDKYNSTTNTMRVELQNIHNELRTQLNGYEVGGEFNLTQNTKLEAKVARFQNTFSYGNIPNSNDPSYTVVQFKQDGVPVDDATAMIKTNGKYGVRFGIDGGKEKSDFISTHVANGGLDMNKFSFQTLDLYYVDVNETDRFVGQLNLTSKLAKNFELKAGLKFRDKERIALFQDRFFNWGSTAKVAPMLKDYQTQEHPKVNSYLSEMGSPYGTNPFVNVLNVKDLDNFYNVNQSYLTLDAPSSALLSNGGANGRNFTINEKHSAGYVMGTWDVTSKLSLIGGARIEHTDLKTSGYITDIATTGNIIKPIEKTNNYTEVLPMLHMRYAATDNFRVKAAVTQTFARPDFGSLVAGGSYMAQDNEYFLGNPDLKPTKATNIDLMTEIYLGDLGLFTAGAFYKNINNPIFSNTVTMDSFEGHDNVKVTKDMNGDKASILGLEFGFNKKMDFLSGFLSGIGISGNYTFMQSEMTIPGRTDKVRIPRQADHLVNASLYYEYKGFSLRSALNFKDDFIMTHGDNADLDEYYGSYTSMDFTASMKINKNVLIYVEGNNLLNNPMKYFFGVKDRVSQVEYYGVRGQMGVKFTL